MVSLFWRAKTKSATDCVAGVFARHTFLSPHRSFNPKPATDKAQQNKMLATPLAPPARKRPRESVVLQHHDEELQRRHGKLPSLSLERDAGVPTEGRHLTLGVRDVLLEDIEEFDSDSDEDDSDYRSVQRRVAPINVRSYSNRRRPRPIPNRSGLSDDPRIDEILTDNLNTLFRLPGVSDTDLSVESLVRHDAFFVDGLRIAWPFPEVMLPQRQMASHIVRGLRNSQHVVLESPTGTGKSAAILCSALAWQQEHSKKTSERTRILFATRPHSQVDQLIASLRKTPYRPRMAVLASRDRFCIHKELMATGRKGTELSRTCSKLRKATDNSRKKMLRSAYPTYSDENPPSFASDHYLHLTKQEKRTVGQSESYDGFVNDNGNHDAPKNEAVDDDDRSSSTTTSSSSTTNHDPVDVKFEYPPTCKHYRDLTSSRVVSYAAEQLTPSNSSCKCGGEKSKLGTHDVEDLVAFGRAPHIQKGIAVYRRGGKATTFGVSLGQSANGIRIDGIEKGTAVAKEGFLREQQKIVGINGIQAENYLLAADELNAEIDSSQDPLLLDVTNNPQETLSPCPYYMARALATEADIVFLPYNYLLDPTVRNRMKIKLDERTVVVVDEAHNVESVLRTSCSGTFSQVDVAEMVVMLNYFATLSELVESQIIGKSFRELLNRDGKAPRGWLINQAHDLLLFVECIMEALQRDLAVFEQSKWSVRQSVDICVWLPILVLFSDGLHTFLNSSLSIALFVHSPVRPFLLSVRLKNKRGCCPEGT